jgi:hypothetical protein
MQITQRFKILVLILLTLIAISLVIGFLEMAY